MAAKKKPSTPRSPRGVSKAEVQVIIQEALDKAGIAQVTRVAEETAAKAVQSTLLTLGVDISDPIKAQSTFAAVRQMVHVFADPSFQADLAHLREMRQTVGEIKATGRRAFVNTGVSAIVGIMLAGVGIWWNSKTVTP